MRGRFACGLGPFDGVGDLWRLARLRGSLESIVPLDVGRGDVVEDALIIDAVNKPTVSARTRAATEADARGCRHCRRGAAINLNLRVRVASGEPILGLVGVRALTLAAR